MASLSAHLRRPDDHGRLGFHAGCPLCRDERLAGALPVEPLVSRRAQAAVMAGVLALTSVAPTAAFAQADQDFEGAQTEDVVADADGDFAPSGDTSGAWEEPAVEPAEKPANARVAPAVAPAADVAAPAPVPAADAEAPGAAAPAPAAGDAEPEASDPDAASEPAPTGAQPPATAEEAGQARDTADAMTRQRTEEAKQRRRAAREARQQRDAAREATQQREATQRRSMAWEATQRRSAQAPPDPAARSVPRFVAPAPAPAPRIVAASTRTAATSTAAPVVRPWRAAAGDDYHVVARGESLWSIAADVLGSGASPARVAREVNRLWELNQDRIGTGDRDLLVTGTRLAL